jgi:quercetin dioxygenase-like cupin family protein
MRQGEETVEGEMSEEKLPAGKAILLPDLVDYAEGAVVSRTLAKTKGGTVTLFAFDAGQGLSEHSAPFDALVQVLDGTVEIKIGDDLVQATAGETVLMPANIPHALQAVEKFKMLLTMVRE